MEPRLFRVLVLEPDDDRFIRLRSALRATGSVADVARVPTVGDSAPREDSSGPQAPVPDPRSSSRNCSAYSRA